MSDKNIYNQIKELCDSETKLDFSADLICVDEELVNEVCNWVRRNIDLKQLARELFNPQQYEIVRGYVWTNPEREVPSRLYQIMMGEVGTELVNKQGKYNVRLKKCLRKVYNVKSISDQDFCKISTIVGDWKERMKLHYKFVDTFDWEQGDFGDDGSCYWGDRAAARDTLEHYHAFAVLFYKLEDDGDDDEYDGCGRAWIAPLLNRKDSDGAVVVFNRYGVPRDMDTVVASILKIDQNLKTNKVYLTNEGSTSHILYANGDAVVISYDGYLSDRLELGYRIHYGRYDEDCNDDRYTCDNCGDRVHEDDVYGVQDDTLCEHCYHRLAGYCECCGGNYYNDDLHNLVDSSDRICEHCIERRGYVMCESCDGYDLDGNMYETTNGETVCESCSSSMTQCECCDKFIDDENNINDAMMIEKGTDIKYDCHVRICDSCYDEYTYTCETCKLVVYDDDDNDRTLCPRCEEVKDVAQK